MRHKCTIRKFNRTPKHRKAMFRNLATNLVTHERITTTAEKAKELRPLIERLISRAKGLDYQGNVFLKQILFTKKAIHHVKTELVPRFELLPAGYTRIKYLGLRKGDRARMCYIEFIGNPIEVYEKNEIQAEKERLGIQSFWSWEHKLLRQEQEYFENLIHSLDAQIQDELDQFLSKDTAAASTELNNQLRKDIESKYAKKRVFFEASLKRAQLEESVHLKQEKYNRYERLTENYAFPQDFVMHNENRSANPRINA